MEWEKWIDENSWEIDRRIDLAIQYEIDSLNDGDEYYICIAQDMDMLLFGTDEKEEMVDVIKNQGYYPIARFKYHEVGDYDTEFVCREVDPTYIALASEEGQVF